MADACQTCAKKFATHDLVVKCFCCDAAFHPDSCSGVSVANARSYSDPAKKFAFVFLCDVCKCAVPKMKLEVEAQRKELDQLKETVNSLLDGNVGAGARSPPFTDATDNDTNVRLSALESKFDSLMSKMADLCTQFNPDRLAQVVASAAAQATCDAVLSATKEASEAESKKLNVVVYGLVPSSDQSDIQQMKVLLENVGLKPEWAVDMWRDGPTPSEPGKFRFCKLTLASMHAKSMILQAARNKKFGSLYIRRDLTFNEREARRKIAKARQESGVATSGVVPRMHTEAMPNNGAAGFSGGARGDR
jgi:hypothetical protein